MGKAKSLIIIAIIFITIAVSSFSPKIKYQSFDIINYINLPLVIGNWLGEELPDNKKDAEKWDFINKSKQYYFRQKYEAELYQYYYFSNKGGGEVFLSLLNAGNFHNPKNCYTGLGYKSQFEGAYSVKLAKNTTLQFDSYLMLKENNDLLTTYWMCVNGKKVTWLELKLNELICSLTNKESINVLTRIDVPTNPGDTYKALTLTKEFLRDLYGTLDKDRAVYIFGE